MRIGLTQSKLATIATDFEQTDKTAAQGVGLFLNAVYIVECKKRGFVSIGTTTDSSITQGSGETRMAIAERYQRKAANDPLLLKLSTGQIALLYMTTAVIPTSQWLDFLALVPSDDNRTLGMILGISGNVSNLLNTTTAPAPSWWITDDATVITGTGANRNPTLLSPATRITATYRTSISTATQLPLIYLLTATAWSEISGYAALGVSAGGIVMDIPTGVFLPRRSHDSVVQDVLMPTVRWHDRTGGC